MNLMGMATLQGTTLHSLESSGRSMRGVPQFPPGSWAGGRRDSSGHGVPERLLRMWEGSEKDHDWGVVNQAGFMMIQWNMVNRWKHLRSHDWPLLEYCCLMVNGQAGLHDGFVVDRRLPALVIKMIHNGWEWQSTRLLHGYELNTA